MQNIVEGNRAEASQAQRQHLAALVGMALVLGLQGALMLIGTIVDFLFSYSLNPPLALTLGFLSFDVSLFLILLSWGLATFKHWAYWMTLMIEVLLLIQNILTFLVLKRFNLLQGPVAFAPVLIVYLLASRKARTIFFQNKARFLSENERRGILPRMFE